jgi:hypothetical protein
MYCILFEGISIFLPESISTYDKDNPCYITFIVKLSNEATQLYVTWIFISYTYTGTEPQYALVL